VIRPLCRETTTDPILDAEILRYGEFVELCYNSFDDGHYSEYYGTCKLSKRFLFEETGFGISGYQITKCIYSPSVPLLLEWPCNTTATNDQETRSYESESGTYAKAHDVSFFRIPMECKLNLMGHHLHQSQYGNSSSYPDSLDQLSEMQSSYMHNLMLDDPRIHMNMMPIASLSTVSDMRRDHISPILDQRLPGL
jgi:hypothetical protein